MKVHLRILKIGPHTYRVVTLRPQTRVTFSTNYYHNTWHIVSDMQGSRLLARLLWGLSYQRLPGTLVLVHEPHIRPTPFEAERSDPFLLIPADLTQFDNHTLRVLKGQLDRLRPPTNTVRWLTFGLDAALAGRSRNIEPNCLHYPANRRLWQAERMGRCGGFIYYSAPPPVLRQQSLRIHSLHVRPGNLYTEMDYHFLAESTSKVSWCGDGEVQIFADFQQRVSAAIQARREILPQPNQVIISETIQEIVSRRRDEIKYSRRRNAGAGNEGTSPRGDE
jgi:hypothetical protein